MSAPPTMVPPGMLPPKFDNTLGALLVGGLVAMALWGITCVQTYNYYMRANKDRIYLKLMVGFLWALDTFDSALNGHILYYYMVSNYLNPLAIFKPVWSVIIHVAATSISNFLIRTMFAHRIFRLSKGNILLTAWVMAISFSDLVVGVTITVKAFGIPSFPDLDKLSGLMYTTFALGTGSDLSVAVALSWLLYRSQTGFRRTDSLIMMLMMYTVNTGMIVAIDASLGMILYIVMPNNFIFLGFYLLLSKLYLNSYLATLNARELLRGERNGEMVSIHLSQISQSRRYDVENSIPTIVNEKTSTGKSENTMSISIQTLIDKKIDDESSTAVNSPRDNSPRDEIPRAV
ncbi:hypothetical protein NLJ89_g4092 [Agrocybe chaxingu]|uniref:DUF6534 domain-containing protein n=1 Tax=Agrocybe chaxingu TaxID=84603 RepID=A0A9W8K3I1_9AGAR|nr:hypothetical protein NLJ89_g4092 [Agrocybe chaxingu]